jgi:hypothetical protein
MSALSLAQTPQILKLTGYPHVAINAMVQDGQGNFYVTGGFSQTADFGGRQVTSDDTSSGAFRFFAAKYDKSGTLIWLHTETGVPDYNAPNPIADQGGSIVLDKAGNVYIAGEFESIRFTLDGTVLTNADQKNNTQDILLVKYSPAGDMLWGKRFGGTDNDELAIVLGPDGKLYAAGSSASPSLSFSQITLTGNHTNDAAPLLATFDTSGTAIWATIFPARIESALDSTTGGDDKFVSLALDSSGTMYVAGELAADSSQIGDSLIVQTQKYFHTIIFAKFTANDGHLIWEEHSNGAPDLGLTQSVVVDKNNNPVFCSGFTGAVLNIAGVTLQNPNPRGATAIGIIKCNPSGHALWGKILAESGGADTTGGIVSTALACSPGNDLYISGLGYGGNPFVYNGGPLPLSNAAINIFLLKVNTNGDFNWLLDGTFNGEGLGTTILFDHDNSIYYAGYYGTFGRELRFGNDSLPTENAITSFNMHLKETSGLVHQEDLGTSASIAYPNPAIRSTMIELPQNSGPAQVLIFDALGRKIESIDGKNTNPVSIPCENLPKGVYYYRVIMDIQSIASGKFVVE